LKEESAAAAYRTILRSWSFQEIVRVEFVVIVGVPATESHPDKTRSADLVSILVFAKVLEFATQFEDAVFECRLLITVF
jgi:hypothetical protein